MENSEKLVRQLGFDRVKLDEPLRLHTYMKVGGPADLYFEAKTQEDLIEAVKSALETEVPYTVLGSGANVLVSDKGIKGLTVVNKAKNIKFLPHSFVEVDSGVNLVELSREAGKRGLGGLERMTKVPATVGGAIFMNAGDTGKGEFFEDLVVSIKILNEKGEVQKLFRSDAEFSYRSSRFQKTKEIVLSAKLELTKMTKEQVDEKVADILVRKQHHPAGPSVGSTFRNPPDEHAGDLIEKCNLKGTVIGGAKISDQHANFIINTGNAKASDVKSLIDLIKAKVKEKFGLDLQEEVLYLGEW